MNKVLCFLTIPLLVTIDLYTQSATSQMTYVIPGPPLYGAAAAPPSNPSPGSTAVPTSPATTNAPSSTAAPGTVAQFGQCGGIGYTGATGW